MKDKFFFVKKKLAKDRSMIHIDIETSPLQFWGWQPGEQYVTHKQIVEGSETKIITIQWMFEGDKKVSYLAWDKDQNDKQMLKKFLKVLKPAKVIITQNGKAFDMKVLQYRLNIHGLAPMPPIAIFDTLTLSRASFRAPSHKLDYRSKIYGYGGKIPMEMDDWIAVLERKPGALEKMIRYGCKDIPDMRKIFWKELPYYPKLPASLSQLVYPEDAKARDFCPICASKRQKRYDVYATSTGSKPLMKCRNCGHSWKETRKMRTI